MRWFVDITSWEPIAMDVRQLVRAFEAGRIDADTLVWRKGMADWHRLRDVEELAERLLGEAPKSSTGDAPRDAAADTGSEPPPRREGEAAERRVDTPPADYGVSPRKSKRAHRPGAPTAREDSPGIKTLRGGSSAVARGQSVELAGASDARNPAASANDDAAERDAKRPSRRSEGEDSSRPQRTGTPAMGTRTARAALAARAQRSGTPSLGQAAEGPRRVPSSDETPAQKPSSMSVPPGTITTSPSRPRGRHIVMAAVALVMGLVIIQRTMLDDAPSAPSDDRGPSAVAPSPSAEEQRMALAPTLVDPTPQRPTRQGPEATSETTTEPAVAPIAAPEVDPAPSASSSPASPPARPRTASAPKTSAPKKVSPPAKPRPAAVRRPAPKPQAQAAPAPAPKTASDPALAQAPRMVVKPSELEAGAASPQPAAASPAAGSPAPGSAAPGAATKKPAQAPSGGANAKQFRTDLARQQMGIAAGKAATCGQAGKAHGAGKVRVLIESWGRVAQVTHLNQSFVGTPVGLCVMQAFQQVRVPPFEGGAQTLTASFTVPPPTPPAATAPATPAPQSPQ